MRLLLVSAIVGASVPYTFAQPVQNAPVQDTAAAMAAAADRQRAAVQQTMATGLDRQRDSIRVQARTAVEVPPETGSSSPFFTVPWPKPVSMLEGMVADCDPLPSGQVDALIGENAKAESVSPDLLREVMRKESGFRPCAISRAGAQGLMQLMPATAQQFHVSDPFDPKQNTAAGAKFLKSLLDRYWG